MNFFILKSYLSIGNLPQIFVKDQNINLTEHEKLNEFPSTILILNPGGCAHFEFPIEMEQINMFIQSCSIIALLSISWLVTCEFWVQY